MPKYNFYYDESEHSRKINYTTISASNYYDNFHNYDCWMVYPK